jgi:hypothetical protein
MGTRRRTARFDDLVEALQSEVARAQRTIDRRHQGRLQQLLDLDGKGGAEALSYVFQVKIPGPGGERSLRVPLLTLRPYIQHRVVAASLELKTAFEETRPARPGSPPALAASVGGDNRLGRTLHRLRIALFGPQPGAGEISLDGRHLRDLTPPGKS